MAHIYMQFDFGKDEGKAQVARHKLEIWKQAFRLDKKLLYKFERFSDGAPAAEPMGVKAATVKPEKSKGKSKGKLRTPIARHDALDGLRDLAVVFGKGCPAKSAMQSDGCVDPV